MGSVCVCQLLGDNMSTVTGHPGYVAVKQKTGLVMLLLSFLKIKVYDILE